MALPKTTNIIITLVSKCIPSRSRLMVIEWMLSSTVAGIIVDGLYKLTAKEKIRTVREFFQENESRIGYIASFLEDEKSKAAYRSLIHYRYCRKRSNVSPFKDKWKTMYLDQELITPSESEVFIDCGAYTGETSLLFHEYCLAAGRPAPQCILFEPDAHNRMQLTKNLSKFVNKPIVFPMGLWREAGNLNFSSVDISSKIYSAGPESIAVDSLDHILETAMIPSVTYIKIDVEGADLDVLYGARRTIQKYRPRIAIAIYHTDEHMLAIPETIHEMCPEYRFFIRHYTSTERDTVLYCLP